MNLLRKAAGMLAMTALAVTAVILAAHPVLSSDHQDSPTVVANPMEDITDVFAYPAPDAPGTNVVLQMDFNPLIPAGMANSVTFDPNVLYQFKLSKIASSAVENEVIQMKADGASGSPTFTVYGPAAPNEVGTRNTIVGSGQSVPFNQATTLSNGVKVFIGPRRDPFYFDLAQFFKILPDRNYRNQPNPPPPTAASFNWPSTTTPITLNGTSYGTAGSNNCVIGTPSDFLANYNVETFIIELPASMLATTPGKLGLWATTSTPSGS